MVRILVSVLIFFLLACSSKTGRSFIPHIPGYDEGKMELKILPKKLKEISGMFYLPDGRILAMNDEKGILFFLRFEDSTENISTLEFAGKADYEDIAMVDSTYYVLESNGNIHQVTGLNSDKVFEFERKKKMEFESIYYDKNANKLVMITKDHKHLDQTILAYAFDLSTMQFLPEPYYSISMREVHFRLKNSSILCKPSAAAIHPITHKLFILASVGTALLECSLDGKVERAFQINPVQFPQPEGITFAPNGDMYISNEGVNGKGTILKFPYTDPGKSK